MKMRKKYNFNANVRTCSKTYRAICIASTCKYGNIQFIILFNCKIQEDLLYFNDTCFFFRKGIKVRSILKGTALLPCGSLPVF